MKTLYLLVAVVAVSVSEDSPALKELKLGNLEFSAKTYKVLSKERTGNLLVCPLSVAVVLALVKAGAGGETAKQIISGLNLPADEDKFNEAFKTISPSLNVDNHYTLSSANKVYIKTGYKINKNFKQIATSVFNADIQDIDFTSSSAASQINNWVLKKTHDKIKDLISSNDLDEDTRAVLVNALYFHGLWVQPFSAEDTQEEAFHINNKREIKVKMMTQTDWFNYYLDENLKAQFLEMHYFGSPISMIFVLPKDIDGLPVLEANMEKILVLPKFSYEKVHVKIPRVNVKDKIDFIPVLKQFGVLDAFENNANFSGLLDNDERLKLSKVVQKTFIKVEEAGTTAAAATAGTAGFNSAHGCIKCTEVGEYDKGGRHMSFPRVNCPLRTDESFRNKTDEDHHKEDTPLLKLPIDMVDDIIVADSLHLFDLGIMRKCLYGWVNGSYNFRTKLSAAQIDQLSDMLEDCNTRKPVEIHRAIRRLKFLKCWKGTEYRTFLLYVGPVVLEDFLSCEAYHNFLTLSCAVTIISSNAYLKYIHIAEQLLKDFVEQFIDIYGIDAISSNVHNTCHVINDVRKFGPLPEISSYAFENFLGHLKSLLHSGSRPLPQLAKRVIELSKYHSVINTNPFLEKPYVKNENHSETHQLSNCNRIFNKVCIRNDFILCNDDKNRWFMTKTKDIISMINATYCKESIYIYGAAINAKTDSFVKPLRSSHLNIYTSDGRVVSPRLYALNEVYCKLISFKHKQEFIFMPLIHTLDVKTL